MNSYIDEISERYARNEVLQKAAKAKGQHSKVFDWDKAARIIKERNPQRAAAGLREDWFWTGGTIWRDGKICTDEPPYLLSYWATPIIILKFEDGEEEIECWMQADESAWDEDTNWPESARKILGV